MAGSRLWMKDSQTRSCKYIEAMVFCYQNCFSDLEKVLKFEAEGREFSKILRSLLIQTKAMK